jgi:hypothetical protein
VFSKSKIFKFLKRDCGTIPVAEIINGKIEIFSKPQRFLIATESSKYLLIFVLYVCVILCEFGTAISKGYACFCCLCWDGSLIFFVLKCQLKTELVYFEKYNVSIQIVNKVSVFFFILSIMPTFQCGANFN